MTTTLAATVLPPLATVEQYLEAHPGTPPENLDDLLASASSTIRRYCGWHIAPVIDEARILDGPGGPTVFLPTLQLLSLTSVSDVGAVLDVASIEWSADGMLRKSSGWTYRFRGIEAEYLHGYELAEVPELTQLAIAMANRSAIDPTGLVASKAVGSVSISYAPGSGSARVGLMDAERATLAYYRLPVRL